jgi:hypothetical protein
MAKEFKKWGVVDYMVTGGIILVAGISIAFVVRQIKSNAKVIKDSKEALKS